MKQSSLFLSSLNVPVEQVHLIYMKQTHGPIIVCYARFVQSHLNKSVIIPDTFVFIVEKNHTLVQNALTGLSEKNIWIIIYIENTEFLLLKDHGFLLNIKIYFSSLKR